jgi:multidrug efflux pump subunit AcrA (membrane-fusion protein)
MRHPKNFLLTVLALFALAGCTRKETEEKRGPAEKQEENVVTLTKEQREHIELKIEPAVLGSLETTLRTAGRVVENANKTAKVASTFEGRIIKLNFDLNDRLKAGDVVGLVEAPEFLGKPLELRAPIDGAVIERKSTVGELVTKGSAIYTISEPKELWLIAEVREHDIGAIKEGQPARFNVLAYPGERFEGKVDRIGTTVEREARTIEVRIGVDNGDGRLKPGMFATVEIVVGQLDGALVVPVSAIQREGDTESVFVAVDVNRFEKRPVKTGLKQPPRVQILEGLKAGEQIVSDGGFILKSEMMKGELGED